MNLITDNISLLLKSEKKYNIQKLPEKNNEWLFNRNKYLPNTMEQPFKNW